MNEKEAYQALAETLNGAADENWLELKAICPILSDGCGGVVTTQIVQGDGKLKDVPIGMGVFDIEEACLALREYMFNLTGDRIWGLTFTLYPTGKFEIDYDYNKPEGYEETDETITGEEVNQSLFDLGFRAAPTDKDPKGNE